MQRNAQIAKAMHETVKSTHTSSINAANPVYGGVYQVYSKRAVEAEENDIGKSRFGNRDPLLGLPLLN